jgi:hypothetical protein
MTVSLRKRSAEREQFLSDVMTTAVEGGINYWASVSDYRWDAPFDQQGVTVYDHSGDELPPEGKRVTPEDIASAISKMRANKDGLFAWAHRSESYWVQFWLADRTNGEDGDYDAGIADCILQVAVFGDVIFG